MSRGLRFTVIFLALAVMLFTITMSALADDNNNPADVPTNHWAYKAVKLLIDKGYLQLYQDQTFQGDKPVDRYTMAVIVAKILNEIASGQVGTNKEDMELIKRLTNEFRNEFVGVNSKNNIYMRKLDDLFKEQTVLKEDTTRLTDEQQQYRQEVQQMIADIKSLQDENVRLRADVERLRADYETTKKQQTIYIVAAFIVGFIGAVK
jgi:hypothetical protein